jgi:hypothetical protein
MVHDEHGAGGTGGSVRLWAQRLTGKGADGVVVKMPGGHHFGGGYAEIAAEILSRLPKF